ncbi:MAG: hypothetical protein KAU35_04155 [candidate division Zixibacteria bacterium]|nr:hypothetical protein [candidate division Zixibacteria bacterium]
MVIGFRSFTDGFAYVILGGTQLSPKVVAKERLSLPKGHTWNSCLSWVRKQVAEITQTHEIEGACIKLMENWPGKKSVERMQIEAVFREFLHNEKSLECNARIKSQLRRDIKGFTESARYLDRVLTGIEALAELNNDLFRDATLAAVSELPEE